MRKPGMVAAMRRGWGRVVLWAIRPALDEVAREAEVQYELAIDAMRETTERQKQALESVPTVPWGGSTCPPSE